MGTSKMETYSGVTTKICELKGEEKTGDWRKLHNEGLLDLYSIPNIILVIK
jgi:hypothetical protein